MPSHIDFYFDLSSPWTRLAFHNIQPILLDTGAAVTWRPILVGGIFNAVNGKVYTDRANPNSPAIRHGFRWLHEWAQLAGVAMNFPTKLHPLRSVSAMRFCCALENEQEALRRFMTASFAAYFADGRNLDDMLVLEQIAVECGLDGPGLATRAASDEIKAKLRANTDVAIAKGAFGSPTMIVDDEHLYFGNDQMPLVSQRIRQPVRS